MFIQYNVIQIAFDDRSKIGPAIDLLATSVANKSKIINAFSTFTKYKNIYHTLRGRSLEITPQSRVV